MFSRLKKSLYDKRYFLKLSLFYFVISFFLTIFLSVIFDNAYTSISGKYIHEEEKTRSRQIASRIESLMKEYLSLSIELAANDDIHSFFRGKNGTENQTAADRVIEKYFLYKKGEEEIHLISVMADKYVSTGYIPNIYLYRNWGILYELSKSEKDHLFFSSLYRGLSGDTICLSIATKIYDGNSRVIGYVIIDVYRNKLQSILFQSQASQSSIKITDRKNFVMYSSVDRYDEGAQYTPIVQSDYVYTFSLPLLDSTFTLNYEVKNTFLLDVKERFRSQLFLLVVISIMVSMFTALIISSGLRKPINKLIQTMKIVGKGNLDAQIDLKKRNDLHELQDEFNKLVRKLKHLQEENIENVRLMHQAQIAFLQAQIKPHFLYNMLATIKGMVSCSPPEDVKTAIVTLTKLLRNSFDFSNELRTLKEHLSIISCYVDMQNYRFPGRFHLVMDAAAPGALSCRMPPLLLQPIVENSIIHGFADKEEECTITITAESDADYLYIIIHDNGAGIPGQILDEIHEPVLDDQTPHIGLKNVIRRIRYFYDETCYILIESEINRGTTVRYKLRII